MPMASYPRVDNPQDANVGPLVPVARNPRASSSCSFAVVISSWANARIHAFTAARSPVNRRKRWSDSFRPWAFRMFPWRFVSIGPYFGSAGSMFVSPRSTDMGSRGGAGLQSSYDLSSRRRNNTVAMIALTTKYTANNAREVATSGTYGAGSGGGGMRGGVSAFPMIPDAAEGMNHGCTPPAVRATLTIVKMRKKRKNVRTVAVIVPLRTAERRNATPTTHAMYASAYAAERPISQVTWPVTIRAAIVAAR